jgi:hypothetical protein
MQQVFQMFDFKAFDKAKLDLKSEWKAVDKFSKQLWAIKRHIYRKW